MGLVELGRYANPAAAYIVRGRLEADGIEAFCFDTGMNAIEGVPQAFPVRLMVLDEDFSRARYVLGQRVAPAEEEVAVAQHPGAAWLKRRRRAWLLFGAILASWLAWLLLMRAG